MKQYAYLYPCRNGNRTDRLAMHRLDNKAHTGYSNGLNAMETHRSHMNIGQGHCTTGTIHDMFCMSASVDHRIVNPGTPCTGHRPT